MIVTQLLKQKSAQKIGKAPVVIVPLHIWNEMKWIVEDWEIIHATLPRKNKKTPGLKRDKNHVIKEVVQDFHDTNLYSKAFLKDLEVGLRRSSYAKHHGNKTSSKRA